MKWKELLAGEFESAYKVAEGLVGMVKDEDLSWKPATGDNWLTTGQLLKHIGHSCGDVCQRFITKDWSLPEGYNEEDFSSAEMATADKFPTVTSVAEAKKLLAADKEAAFDALEKSGDDVLANMDAPTSWDPRPLKLGIRFLQMIHHLISHYHQLFYYLKLQGTPVNTYHLWAS
jgi:hypothetical protein